MTRSIKIEATGDFSANKIKPLIRLKGNWLALAGFGPNKRAVIRIDGQTIILTPEVKP